MCRSILLVRSFGQNSRGKCPYFCRIQISILFTLQVTATVHALGDRHTIRRRRRCAARPRWRRDTRLRCSSARPCRRTLTTRRRRSTSRGKDCQYRSRRGGRGSPPQHPTTTTEHRQSTQIGSSIRTHVSNISIYSHTTKHRRLGGRVVSVLDSGAEGPGFKSQPQRRRVTVLGKLFTPIVPLFTKQQNW